MDRTRYLSLYVEEAAHALAAVEAELPHLPTAPAATAAGLLRCFHTLKGMSTTLELEPLATLAHAFEELCDALVQGMPPDDTTPALFAAGLAQLRTQVKAVAIGHEPDPDLTLEARVWAHVRATRAAAAPLPAPALDDEPEPEEPSPGGAVAALAEVVAACRTLRGTCGGDPGALAAIARAEHAARRMYGQLAALRAVPFGTIVPPLRRRLRGLCHQLGKDARLDVEGEGVLVDADVLGALQTALIQLLQNALVHGVEAPADRGAKGPIGRLTLTAERVGRRLVVRFADDGRGLDGAALRVAAGAPTGDPVELALRPGVTTAPAVGLAAGRGQGLPAAQHRIQRLGGRLELASADDAGARLRIEVPLQADLVPLLLVQAGGQTVALLASCARPADGPSGAEPLFGWPVDGDQALALADGRFVRVDGVIGVVEALVRPPPPPLYALPHVIGTTAAPEGHILLVVDPSALFPRDVS